ncbi:shikimate dehydrogenase [Pantoea sp. 1.19]|uniref:shikimate dehydrogenase n=1 Tax=Pantoea sp. 1.19 TaxID=1925589 RepID=UPI0009491F5F|nr:shikimate dehydrogenase [Pantoea sp. 1.19]
MDNFVVFGNPVSHSKSPRIHQLFAEQTGIDHRYGSRCAPLEGFAAAFHHFVSEGGAGANVTVPFKQDAWQLANVLSDRAAIAGAVNTLKRLPDGRILGDNTDGVGLLSDLQRLSMICHGDRILLVGAGGAARGVIQPLLDAGAQITVVNRTRARAEELAALFAASGRVKVRDIGQVADSRIDLIINATSSGIQGEVPSLPAGLITPAVRCYDMFYGRQSTPFLDWCRKQGATQCADGLGMLVGQAAHAFQVWHGILPETAVAIATLKAEMCE